MVSGKSESFSRKKDQWPAQNQNEKLGKRKRPFLFPNLGREFSMFAFTVNSVQMQIVLMR